MNLTLSQANKAIKYLKEAEGKGVLLYKNDSFKYLPVNSVSKEKGYIKDFGYNAYSVIHEDLKNEYHISINGKPIDLSQVYYHENGNKWVNIGSKIKPKSFSYRNNIYIYKKNEKIPKKLKKTNKKVEVINPMGKGGARLEIREEDARYNGATVALDRYKSF